MKYRVDPPVFQMFPNFCRGVVAATDVRNGPSSSEITSMVQELEQKIRTDSAITPDHPRLKAWEEAYARFGANPKKYTPSIVFLVSRIKKGNSIRTISKAVDLFNVISLKYLLPCGGDDVETIEGGLTLSIANGKETFSPLFKPETIEHPEPGEVIYVDRATERVICRRWTWRNADFSKITPQTSSLVINVDGMLPAISRAEIEQATHELANLMRMHCGATVSEYYLDSQSPEVELAIGARAGTGK